jgi:N6-adenosine-specific RNA methylase IME4
MGNDLMLLFDPFVAATRSAGKQLTSGALVKLGRQQPNGKRAFPAPPIETITGSLQSLIDAGHRFACVYADPPWKYGNQTTRASTDNHYQTMTVPEICAESVANVTADIAHLYLWTTAGFLREAFDVINAWGFTYKTNMVWTKPTMGIGNYVRLSHEHLLIGVKGKTRTRGSNQMSWVQADRTKHSAKPDCFRAIIERMSDGPYLEMYGRKPVGGWTVYGNQIESTLFA